MKCDRCPASWESGGMTSCGYECDSYGCMILGTEMLDDNCKLSKAEIEKRIQQLKDYEAGKIDRPQWVVNRFIREMDDNWATGHRLGIFLPGFPPPKMMNGCYEHIESAMGVRDNCDIAYRKGYEDAKRDFMIPAADVAPVVRCRDCKHAWIHPCGYVYCHRDGRNAYEMTFNLDSFCSYGERKDNG